MTEHINQATATAEAPAAETTALSPAPPPQGSAATAAPSCRWFYTILAVLLLGLVSVIALPLLYQHGRYDRALVDRIEQSRHFRTISAERPALMEQLALVQQDPRLLQYFYSGKTAAVAGAQLQEKAKGIIEAQGGELVSTNNLPPTQEQDGNATRITISLRMTGSTNMLKKVLGALEESQPPLFFDNVSIRPVRRGRYSRELDVSFELSAYFLEKRG